MKMNEIEAIAKKMVDERLEKACERMGEMTILRDGFVELMKNGFTNGAKSMRNMIMLYLLVNPNASELEVVQMLAEKVGYKL